MVVILILYRCLKLSQSFYRDLDGLTLRYAREEYVQQFFKIATLGM